MRLLPAITAAVLLAAPARAADLADTLASEARFGKFVELVQRAGLTPSLRASAPLTVLAPTDEAFARVPQSMLTALSPDAANRSPNQEPDKLQALVRIHLLAGLYGPDRIVGQAGTVTNEAGTRLVLDGTVSGRITVTSVPINVGGPNIAGVTTPREAQVVGEPIAADNGLIYPIDNVLIQ